MRPWSASVWRSSSAAPRAEGAPRAASSAAAVAALGDVGDGEQVGIASAQTSSSPPRTIAVAVDFDGRFQRRRSRGGRGPGRCRRSPPRRRRRRGRCRGSSRPRGCCRSGSPSRWCRSRARRRWSRPRRAAVSSSISCAPSVAGRVDQVAALDRSAATGDSTRPTPAIEPSTTSVPSAVPSTGAMKPSPQGRLPKAPRGREFAGVGDRLAALESEPSGRCRWRQVIRASEPRLSSVGDRPAAAAQLVHVGAHHAGPASPR